MGSPRSPAGENDCLSSPLLSSVLTMFLLLSLVLCLTGQSPVSSHSVHSGQCPTLTPMAGFDWDQFSAGLWFVTDKFDTKSTCLTYEFKTDNLGFKSIEQINQIPYTNKLGIDNHYIYTGQLYTPQESKPANMIVRFPLNIIGSSNFVVLDTDYSGSGLVCTCQDINLLFTFAHRRSCSILHRDPQADTAESSERLKSLLNSQVEDASHDFDEIQHDGCNYGDDSGFNINVDKILGQGEEVTITDDNYDLYYGDYEGDVEILSSAEIEQIKKEFENKAE